MEKRPMTDAEEKVLERALKWWRDRQGLGCSSGEVAANLEAACFLLNEERTPKPITPEERAVVEAAKAVEKETAKFEDSGWAFSKNHKVLCEAVRRLPP